MKRIALALLVTPLVLASLASTRLYVSFGQNVGMFCYTLDGKLLWKKHWTPQPIYLDFGTASSPAIHESRVYVARFTSYRRRSSLHSDGDEAVQDWGLMSSG